MKNSSTREIILSQRCYNCGVDLEEGFVTVPGERDDETGYVGDDDYLCADCADKQGLCG